MSKKLHYMYIHEQMVPERPITWCNDANHPNTLIGNISWYVCNTADV